MAWFDSLLYPIMVAVAWIMVRFHDLLSFVGLDPAGGAAWALSIVGLVIVIRMALIPLFFKQIKASRGMQIIAPEVQAIQKKYKGRSDPASREAMSRETMELYKKHGTNPFASCLPILAQSPIFFALFRVLYSLTPLAEGTYTKGGKTLSSIGPLTQELAAQAEKATIFGAPLSGTFMASPDVRTKLVAILLIVAMSATTFLTQRQLTMKNMPPSALEGPMAQQQKMLLYAMPVIFAVSGINFPIGVLLYWTTTNVWSMGQQFYTIRRMPAPGSQAEAAFKARQARKAAGKGIDLPGEGGSPVLVIDEKPRGQRAQPKRKDRAKAAGQTHPASSSAPAGVGANAATNGTSSSHVDDTPEDQTSRGAATTSSATKSKRTAATAPGAAGAKPKSAARKAQQKPGSRKPKK